MIAKVARRAVQRMAHLTLRAPLIQCSRSHFSGVIKYQFDDDEYERAPYEVGNPNSSILELRTRATQKS